MNCLLYYLPLYTEIRPKLNGNRDGSVIVIFITRKLLIKGELDRHQKVRVSLLEQNITGIFLPIKMLENWMPTIIQLQW
jgi:hypothetical protein